MNVDRVEHSEAEENIEAEASQMEFGCVQAGETKKATVVQGKNISALTEGQRDQLLRALQEASQQGLPGTSDQPSQGQQEIELTQPEGETEDGLRQRGGFPLGMAIGAPGGTKQDASVDPVEMDKSLESPGVTTPDKHEWRQMVERNRIPRWN